jgi:hypothetical protein
LDPRLEGTEPFAAPEAFRNEENIFSIVRQSVAMCAGGPTGLNPRTGKTDSCLEKPAQAGFLSQTRGGHLEDLLIAWIRNRYAHCK